MTRDWDRLGDDADLIQLFVMEDLTPQERRDLLRDALPCAARFDVGDGTCEYLLFGDNAGAPMLVSWFADKRQTSLWQ